MRKYISYLQRLPGKTATKDKVIKALNAEDRNRLQTPL